MSRYLCISVTFLDPLFHGCSDGGAPEWPPSPMRLFQALLAGSKTGCQKGRDPTATDAAFEWLERQEPPLIVAAKAWPAKGHRSFVPNNDGDRKFDRQDRLTEKRVRPHLIEGEPVVYYLWPLGDAQSATDQGLLVHLCDVPRRLSAFGWGLDSAFANGRIVSADEAMRLSGVMWKPEPHVGRCHDSGQGELRRIPMVGSRADLERAHRSFLASVDAENNRYRPPLKAHVFRTTVYRSAGAPALRPWAGFVLEPSGGGGEAPAFAQTQAGIVSAMLRGRALELARRDSYWKDDAVETYVAGHARKEKMSIPRFSYLPLPSIGHAHCDGLIRRVVIAEPYGASGEHTGWAKRCLRNTFLTDGHSGRNRALLVAVAPGSDTVFHCYTDACTKWFSVTPLLLPGLDDGKIQKAEKLFLQALVQAGLDLGWLEQVKLQKAPFWPGSEHPRRYRVPAHLKHLPSWHARIEFRNPLPGPLAVGAGRHCGMGLCAGDLQGVTRHH